MQFRTLALACSTILTACSLVPSQLVGPRNAASPAVANLGHDPKWDEFVELVRPSLYELQQLDRLDLGTYQDASTSVLLAKEAVRNWRQLADLTPRCKEFANVQAPAGTPSFKTPQRACELVGRLEPLLARFIEITAKKTVADFMKEAQTWPAMLQQNGRLQEGELDPLSFPVESHAAVEHRIGELYEIIGAKPPADIVPPFDALASAFRDAVVAAPKQTVPASAARDSELEQAVRDHFSGAHVYGHPYGIKSVQLDASQWTIVRTGPLIQRRTRKGHTLVQVEGEAFCRLYDATFWQEYDGVGYQHPGTVEIDAFIHLASCR